MAVLKLLLGISLLAPSSFCLISQAPRNLEVGFQSYSPEARSPHSATSHAEDVVVDIPSLSSIGDALPAPKLIRRAGRPWTGDEEQLLLQLRDEQEMAWSEIAEYFTDRTWTALKIRYHQLTRDSSAPPRGKANAWTSEEEARLLDLVESGVQFSEMPQILRGRTLKAIRSKYRTLTEGFPAPNLYKKQYTAAEDELILELAEAGLTWDEIAKHFKWRNANSLRRRFAKLTSTTRRRYSPEEDELILQLAQLNITWKEMAKHFNGRSVKSIKQRYVQLAPDRPRIRSYWTPEQDKELIEAVEANMTWLEMSDLFGKTVSTLKNRVSVLLRSGRLDQTPQIASNRPYTVADFELMRNSVEKNMSWNDIAREHFPGRSAESLRKSLRRYQNRKEAEERGDKET